MTSAVEKACLNLELAEAVAYWVKLYEENLILAQELSVANDLLQLADDNITELRRRVNELEEEQR